ncbi:hypothetical protein TXYLGN1_27990 [Tepidimicrobium xylanilyticum]|uniref:Uncharacterized protein n=1 Tax=Tepidimicrobium xylanilyticum TaxID=1123352 RepID=A0A1H2XG99_9FIRM|nr:hypothetical protein EN5CB1_23140 [Tepidimicrobium xylanilyticum]SDW91786.1 hypothetical protein SAMN05660923_01430 [Tepidimicrobium xylanilyticum]
MLHIIDTFKDFKSCFEDKLDLTIEKKWIYGKNAIYQNIQN